MATRPLTFEDICQPSAAVRWIRSFTRPLTPAAAHDELPAPGLASFQARVELADETRCDPARAAL